MTKNEFRKLFLKALNSAADDAEARLAKPVPRSFVIELHAPRSPGKVLDVDKALDQLYLGNDRFYRVIDISIKAARPGKSVAFVRVSGHAPTGFARTWDPSRLGPFKQMTAETIEDIRIGAD
jgi:hypothetical protein